MSEMTCSCGQPVRVYDEQSGYRLVTVFIVEGERVQDCPSCGQALEIEELREAQE